MNTRQADLARVVSLSLLVNAAAMALGCVALAAGCLALPIPCLQPPRAGRPTLDSRLS